MGTWGKVLLGLSPVLAIVLWLVLQQQEKADSQIQEKHIEQTMNINTFNRDFELQAAEMADNKEDKRLHKVFAEQHIAKNEKIEYEREQAEKRRKALEKKSSDNLNTLESELNSLDSDKDLEINDKDFNF